MDVILILMCIVLMISLIRYISNKTKPLENLTEDGSNNSPIYRGEDDRKNKMFDF